MRVGEPEPDTISSVILAAGAGRRIQPLGELLPKSLLPVLGRPLIVWQLEALREQGITEVVVVIGHLGDRIADTIGDGSKFGMQVTYAEQKSRDGIGHALACAEGKVEHPFLLLLGDIYFAKGDLEELRRRFLEFDTDGVLAVRREDDIDKIRKNYCVEMSPSGDTVRRVVEKPKEPRSSWKGTGLYAFSPDFFEAIRKTGKSVLRDELELTDAIQVYIDMGASVRTSESKSPDFNLSESRDLLDLNLFVLGSQGQACYVAPTAKTGDAVELDRSVVLAGARVENGARLEECLVFEGERVVAGRYRRTIFAGGKMLTCETIPPAPGS